MPFDWALYLTVARTLGAQVTDEAALRSAISRAYYAAFGVASVRMKADGRNVPNTGDAHKVLWDYFESANDKFRRKIGQDGKRLRWRRRQADYDASAKLSNNEVTDSLRTAEAIIRFIGQLK
jgi:uncharacterized protein (UPF0332 family)